MVGWGVTGLSFVFPSFQFPSGFSFRNDECLAIALDSSDPAARDCYHIKIKECSYELDKFTQITTGPAGTANIAIAVSQADKVIALLGKDGINTWVL